jgi:hypothetical protein
VDKSHGGAISGVTAEDQRTLRRLLDQVAPASLSVPAS